MGFFTDTFKVFLQNHLTLYRFLYCYTWPRRGVEIFGGSVVFAVLLTLRLWMISLIRISLSIRITSVLIRIQLLTLVRIRIQNVTSMRIRILHFPSVRIWIRLYFLMRPGGLFTLMRIRIRLFTLMRIRILLLIKVMQIFDHLSTDPDPQPCLVLLLKVLYAFVQGDSWRGLLRPLAGSDVHWSSEESIHQSCFS